MISLIVVDYKSIEKTISYIKYAVSNIDNCNGIDVIIVDNDSQSSAEKYIRTVFQFIESKIIDNKEILLFEYNGHKVVYCLSGGNYGYAIGNNIGAKISKELFNNPYLIISNNDLVFQNKLDWKIIKSIFENDMKIGVIGPRIVNLNGTYQSPNKKLGAYNVLIHQYFMDFKPFKWKGDLDYSGESKECYRVSGCFMIIRNDLFEKAGMFDECTFLYGEEMILSERLAKVGAKVYFYDDFHLLHNHGETIKNNAASKQIHKWCYESYVHYFRNYRNTSAFLLIISKYVFKIYLLRREFRNFLKSLIKRK